MQILVSRLVLRQFIFILMVWKMNLPLNLSWIVDALMKLLQEPLFVLSFPRMELQGWPCKKYPINSSSLHCCHGALTNPICKNAWIRSIICRGPKPRQINFWWFIWFMQRNFGLKNISRQNSSFLITLTTRSVL